MNKVYTLRVTVQLVQEDRQQDWDEVLQLRSQELTGDLRELAMMAPAVPHVAEGMALSVLGSEQRRHAQVPNQ